MSNQYYDKATLSFFFATVDSAGSTIDDPFTPNLIVIHNAVADHS